MIVAENISKRYGGQFLFDSLNFRINTGEKIGLVGRNGHGKTTLFRILSGEELPDSGKIIVPKNYTLGYLHQHLKLEGKTVLASAVSALPHHDGERAWEAEKILSGLGFDIPDMEKHPSELSGGFQIRLGLARVLLSEPNLLLLDEPNNYLDIASIRWIIRFLKSWQGEMMLITHDRNFMDGIITHTLGIHRRTVRKVTGTTEKLYNQIATEEEVHEKTRINDERRRKDIELFISRFRAKARLANMVQSRVKMLEKMDGPGKLAKLKNLEFSFAWAPTTSKYSLIAEDISFSFRDDAPPLIRDFSISIGARDRICVIGKNGRGKTTLLKMLAGVLAPQRGSINISQNTVTGYYEQSNANSLAGSRSVLDEIAASIPGNDRQKSRDISGSMLFDGDAALKRIDVLSGGEKSRVMLGKIIAQPSNLLLLDEPTNHLDMESCDALIAALDNYEGAVVMVTHNELFLNALAERLVIFQNNTITLFEGGYDRFLSKVGWDDEKDTADEAPKTDTVVKTGRKEARKLRSELLVRRSRTLKPIETRIAVIENSVDSLEIKLKDLHGEMILASEAGDGRKISELSREIHRCESEIESLLDELTETHTGYEGKVKEFDELLSELN